jgi:restriction system protein
MNKVQRLGGAHPWLLALAVAAVALLFAWIVVPAVLTGSPLADALQKPFEMGGSLIAAMAVIGALKLYLERPIQAGAPLEFDPSPSKANRKIATKKQSTPAAQYEPPSAPSGGWTLDLLKSLEWKRFEDLCNEYSRRKGMRTETTCLGADGGVDIRIYREDGVLMGIVQCKAWRTKEVGVRLIRELAGVMASEKVPHGVFITTSAFTKEAVTFAEKNGIILLDGPGFISAIKKLPPNEQENLLQFATAGDYSTPTCPHCGVKMILRKKYSKFWGCRNFPKCKMTLQVGKEWG